MIKFHENIFESGEIKTGLMLELINTTLERIRPWQCVLGILEYYQTQILNIDSRLCTCVKIKRIGGLYSLKITELRCEGPTMIF